MESSNEFDGEVEIRSPRTYYSITSDQLSPIPSIQEAKGKGNLSSIEHGEDTFISQSEVQSENTPAYLEDFVGILILLLNYFIYSRALGIILSLTFWSLSIYVCVGFLCETISLLSRPKQFSRNYW